MLSERLKPGQNLMLTSELSGYNIMDWTNARGPPINIRIWLHCLQRQDTRGQCVLSRVLLAGNWELFQNAEELDCDNKALMH